MNENTLKDHQGNLTATVCDNITDSEGAQVREEGGEGIACALQNGPFD